MSEAPAQSKTVDPKRLDPPDTPVPHTQVHDRTRRVLENIQDVVIAVLIVLVLALSLHAIWRVLHMAFFEDAPTAQWLSEIVFILILTEVYRLLMFYLREHRISVALAAEVRW